MLDVWSIVSILVKALLYLGVLTSSGLILIRFLCGSQIQCVLQAMRKAAILCALLGGLAAVAGFAVQAAALTGRASGLIDVEMMGMMWQTPVGAALSLRLVGLCLILVGLWLDGVGWIVAALGATLSLWSFTAIGHFSDGEIWLKLLLMVHLIAVSFWIGILLPLKRLLDDPNTKAAAAQLGHRFGQIAMALIPALIAAGLILGWMLVGSWENLLRTGYGLALVAKLSAVVCLLSLGAINKLRFVPSLAAGDSQAAVNLSRTLSLEAVLFAFVLIATAILTTVFALPLER